MDLAHMWRGKPWRVLSLHGGRPQGPGQGMGPDSAQVRGPRALGTPALSGGAGRVAMSPSEELGRPDHCYQHNSSTPKHTLHEAPLSVTGGWRGHGPGCPHEGRGRGEGCGLPGTWSSSPHLRTGAHLGLVRCIINSTPPSGIIGWLGARGEQVQLCEGCGCPGSSLGCLRGIQECPERTKVRGAGAGSVGVPSAPGG